MLSIVEKVVHSCEGMSTTLKLACNIVESIQGAGRSTGHHDKNERLEKSKSVVRILNNDLYCLERALVVCKAKADKDPRYKSIIDSRPGYKTQGKLAKELREKAGLPELPELINIDKDGKEIFKSCRTEEDIEKYAEYLGVAIHVSDLARDYKETYSTNNWKKVPNDDKHHYYVINHNGHFHACTNATGWFTNKGTWCHWCQSSCKKENKCAEDGSKKKQPKVKGEKKYADTPCTFCKKERNGKYHKCCKNCLEDITNDRKFKHQCYMNKGKIKAIVLDSEEYEEIKKNKEDDEKWNQYCEKNKCNLKKV